MKVSGSVRSNCPRLLDRRGDAVWWKTHLKINDFTTSLGVRPLYYSASGGICCLGFTGAIFEPVFLRGFCKPAR